MFVILKLEDNKLKLAYKESMSDATIALEKAKQLALTSGNAAAMFYVCECKYKVFVGMQVEESK